MKRVMKRILFALIVALTLTSGISQANDHGGQKWKLGRLDHVFLVMMENHGYSEIIGNPNAPFTNSWANSANLAQHYYAVGHPSLTNYLEVVGGSNFGVTDDFWPNWIDGGCVDNAPLSTGCNGAITPITGSGIDVASPKTVDSSNPQIGPFPGPPTPNNWALYDYPAASYTAETIADQLVATGRNWKSYQESLPSIVPGVDGVNYSDGMYSSLSPVSIWTPGNVQKLYAVKHNPFVYFANIQEGANPNLSLNQIVDFDGTNGLWADLGSERAPNFAFIAPNQCHDMHGAGSGNAQCNVDADTIQMGDAEVAKLVNGIKSSPVWSQGRNAIIVVWDENDYANAVNRVALIVETNYGSNGKVSNQAYDHFSLTKTLEAGFGLPCLNHACDSTSKLMTDLFQ